MRWIRLFSLVLVAAALLSPTMALASSAGDQQYTDPLAGGGGGSGSSHGSGSSSTSAPSAATSAGSGSSSQTTSSSARTTGAGTGSGASGSGSSASRSGSTVAGRQLPFTGLNVPLVIAVGVSLVGGGLVLRPRVRRQ